MPTYMTETHSLLWAFTRPRKFGTEARRAFEEIANGESNLLIPVIVLAELIFTMRISRFKPIWMLFFLLLTIARMWSLLILTTKLL
jgi:hypothetical protein